MASSAVDGLSGVVRGRVVEQGSPGYDVARALYNAMIDKHPCARDEPSPRQALNGPQFAGRLRSRRAS